MSRKSKLTAEEAHQLALASRLDGEELRLGPWASEDLRKDPKRLSFVLSRYKFVSKMLSGYNLVVEIGCGDGLGLPIVADVVKDLIALDWEERVVTGNMGRLDFLDNVKYQVADLTKQKLDIKADAIYSIDVLEHIEPALELDFMQNQISMLSGSGVMIIGTPNLTASEYASSQSEIGHINLKSFDGLRSLMGDYFQNIFMFGMNDEVLHTGYGPMCHYMWALGVGVR